MRQSFNLQNKQIGFGFVETPGNPNVMYRNGTPFDVSPASNLFAPQPDMGCYQAPIGAAGVYSSPSITPTSTICKSSYLQVTNNLADYFQVNPAISVWSAADTVLSNNCQQEVNPLPMPPTATPLPPPTARTATPGKLVSAINPYA
jgi:hypothetical protein